MTAPDQKAKWYRDIGEQYTAIASASKNALAKAANAAEASKYFGIAARMEAIDNQEQS